MITFYDFAIKQCKSYLEDIDKKDIENEKNFTAFDLSSVLEIIFDKSKEIIIMDIIT